METDTVSLSPSGTPLREDCPCCAGRDLDRFYTVAGVPTNSCLLFDTAAEAAACPSGDVVLAFCRDCGFVFNSAFDLKKTEYSGRYEETQGFSPTFSRFHRDLAARLIERHDLAGKRVTEIGCGKGEFLILLSQMAGVTGIGIDPSARQDRIEGVDGADRVTLIPEYYTEAHGAAGADAVVCKMTLEHIPEALKFMSIIRASLEGRPDTLVFFQIPEALRILETCAFEDIYYEHCAYFSPGSLARLFRRAGFEVLSLGTEYDDQYLTIEARPAAPGSVQPPLPQEDDLARLSALVASFPQRVRAMQQGWRRKVLDAHARAERVVLWGSGSKAVSFLTTLDVGEAIGWVTDINPHRHNHYMPITGQRIVAPQELTEIRPDLVIVMNRIYVPEITEHLDRLGVSSEVVAL